MLPYKDQLSLIQEELVRQIRDATRWSAVEEAWSALLSVRRMADSLIKEEDTVSVGSCLREEKL